MAATRRAREPKNIDELPEEVQQEIASAAPEGWVEEAVGFPPYWKPDLGKSFRGVVLMRDERDPNFVRYHIEAREPVDCQRGPADDGVVETVGTGEIFTTSAFAALPLDRFFGFEVFVLVKGSRRLPGNESSNNMPRDLWEFKVLVSPETKKLLDSQRKENIAYLKELRATANRKAMENMMRLNEANAKSGVSASTSI